MPIPATTPSATSSRPPWVCRTLPALDPSRSGEHLTCQHFHAFVTIVAVQELRQVAREKQRPDAILREQHRDMLAVHRQGGGDFRADEAAPDDRKILVIGAELSQPLVVCQGAVVDNLVAAKGQPPGSAAGSQQQLFAAIDLSLVIQQAALAGVQGDHGASQVQRNVQILRSGARFFRSACLSTGLC